MLMAETINNTNKAIFLYYKLEKGDKVKDIYGNSLLIIDDKPIETEVTGIDAADLFPEYKREVLYSGDIVSRMLDCRKIAIS